MTIGSLEFRVGDKYANKKKYINGYKCNGNDGSEESTRNNQVFTMGKAH